MLRTLLCGLLICASGVLAVVACARDHVDGFDSAEPVWTPPRNNRDVKVLLHQRVRNGANGNQAEQISLQTAVEHAHVELTTPLPKSQIIPDLKLSLYVRAQQDGAQLAVRVIFPHQLNPKTNRAYTLLIPGETYTKVGAWQKLSCDKIEQQIRRELPRLRAELLGTLDDPSQLNLKHPYVDRALVLLQVGQGTASFTLDDLSFGPIVDVQVPSSGIPVKSVASTVEPPVKSPAEFRLDRLFVHGKPFFPRLLAYHGEDQDDLVRLGCNLVWLPDTRNLELMNSLKEKGLSVVATPPHASSPAGEFLDESLASLAPFGEETSPVLFWMLGNRVASRDAPVMSAWTEQVRNADRRFHRHLMADVVGNEAAFSRQVPMLGISREILHGPLTLKEYRNYLVSGRNLAQPGSFPWTWVHTQPAASIDSARGPSASPIIIEPEQLKQQMYAALSAGMRGIGFWTESALDGVGPGALERKLTLAQLNMDLDLLEPFLATGSIQNHMPFTAQLPRGAHTNQLSLGFATGSRSRKQLYELLSERDIQMRRSTQLGRELDATIMRTEYGLLLLPVWLSDVGQYVPDQMAANEASIVVPGVEETASAWEISTTKCQNLSKTRVTGGTKLTLKKFDMTTAIVFTSDRNLIARLQQKIDTLKKPSALACLDLAEAKLARVAEVDRQLQELGMAQPDAQRLVSKATENIRQARVMYSYGDFDGSRTLSADGLQALRILQHACWSDAVRDLYVPASSPHAICYQTLPDHWRMMDRFGRNEKRAESALEGGQFENFDKVVEAGWKREQVAVDGIRAVAELYPRPHKGKFALRLAAVPDKVGEAPVQITEHPITVSSPDIQVEPGQIVYIRGWVKVLGRSAANVDGAMLYDSLAGPVLGLRWTTPTDWQQFGLLREVRQSGPMHLTLALSGIGDILFDDLEVLIVPNDAPKSAAPPQPPRKQNPLEIIRSIPSRLPRVGIRETTTSLPRPEIRPE